MAELVDTCTQVLQLDDGRQVSVAQCGDPNGHPVVFFHPLQGNRFMALTFHALAQRLHLRIIAADRPAIGKSDRLPGRQVAQSTADLLQILEQLGVQKKFSVLAMSAGTMYALAAAVSPALRNRIVGKVTILSPWIPPSSREAPRLTGLQALTRFLPRSVMAAGMDLSNCFTVMQVRGKKQVVELMSRSSEAEKAAFATDPANEAFYSAMIEEWIAQGGQGFAEETQLCLERSYNLHFNYMRDVVVPVRVFAGISDQVMDYTHVSYWAKNAAAGNIELISVPGGTHDGLVHTHKQEALDKLAADIATAAAAAL